MALLSFLGAIQQVTGSCYLIETHDGKKVLLDCGMHQGHREEENRNRLPFAFDPVSIDAVVVSHAHIDHSGLLPILRTTPSAEESMAINRTTRGAIDHIAL